MMADIQTVLGADLWGVMIKNDGVEIPTVVVPDEVFSGVRNL